jgi:hypothetical protein
MRRSSVIPAVAAFVVTLAVLASPAHAQVPPDSLPYVTSIRTLPAQPCDSIPTQIVIEGVFPTSCGRLLNDSGGTIYVSDPNPPCGDCLAGPVAWADTLDLGVLAAGSHTLSMTMGVVDFCSEPDDTTFFHQRFAFSVFRNCQPPPPPFDPMVYVQDVSITSARDSNAFICEGDSIRLRVRGVFPNDCYFLRSITHTPMRITTTGGGVPPVGVAPGPFTVRLVFDNSCCAARVCVNIPTPWQAELILPPGGLGLQYMTLLGAEVCCRDSVIPGDPTGVRNDPFQVVSAESCGVAPPPVTCMYPAWLHPLTRECDARIDTTGSAAVTLMVGNNIPLAGIQGQFHSSGGWPLQVGSIEPVGLAAGMRLTWERLPGGAKFVLFAEQGAPIPVNFGRRETQVLKVTWYMTPMPAIYPAPVPEDPYIISTSDLFGSDINGILVPMCEYLPGGLPFDVAKICVGGGPCDLNGDRYTDVRDLVLMAHCLGGIGPCPADPANSLDCQGDHVFDFDDLVCCANAALGIPPCPECGDSIRTENGIALTFGTPQQSASSIDIPVRIDGRGLFGAARLSFSLPTPLLTGARFELNDPSWLPVSRVTGGKLEVGIVALEVVYDVRQPPPFVEGTLHIDLPPGVDPAGTIALLQADLSGRDGVKLAVDFGSPVVRLGPGLGVSLSAARPNPFGASTTFRLTLDAPADAADLAVYDLSGRRITTIHKGPLAIGSHAFTWNGRTENGSRARAGVFFVRASVGGKVTNQKLVMLRE